MTTHAGAPTLLALLATAGCGAVKEELPDALDPIDGAVGTVDAAGDGGGPDAADPCLLAGGEIVFQTDRDGDTEIARMLADGSGYLALTANTWPDEQPQLSPDGARIAWITRPAGQYQLAVMDRDGANVRDNIAGGSIDAYSAPRWSPDGSALVFARGAEIYRVDADGSGLVNLTADPASDAAADWSPDGSRIVFVTNRRHPGVAANDLYVMNADGSGAAPITPDSTTYLYSRPRWSPAGTIIVVTRQSLAGSMMWKTSPTGGGTGPIGDGASASYEWSPTGDLLAYGYQGDILVVAPAGGVSTNLTLGAATGDVPAWAPTGDRLIFQTDRDGNREVYRMGRDGSGPVNLTADPSTDAAGSWAACR